MPFTTVGARSTTGIVDEATARWATAVEEVGGRASERHVALVDRLVRALKDGGIWYRLDRLWIFAAQNPKQALIDLIAQAPAMAADDPVFVAGKGYVFDGTSQYIDTDFNAARMPSAKYSMNDASFGGFIFAGPSAEGGVEFGNDYGSYSMLVTRYEKNRRFQVNALVDPPDRLPSRDVYTGFFHGQRTSEAISELFLDGVKQGRSLARSAHVPDKSFYVGAGRIGSGPSHYSTASISTAHIGSSLSEQQVGRFSDAIHAYLDAIDALVREVDAATRPPVEGENRGQSISALLGRADLAQRNSDWPAVHSSFKEVRDRYPEERAGWLRGGVAHLRYGDLETAEQLLAEAIRRFPDEISAAVEYALVAAQREDWPEEIRRWAYVRQRFPNERAGWVRGGLTEQRHGDITTAESLLVEVIRRFPDDVSAAVEYAVAAARRQDWPEEIRRWAYVRERFPAERAGWLRGGLAEHRYGDPSVGEGLLAEVVRRFPDDVSAAVEYAVGAAKRQDWPEEIRRWSLVRERFPAERAGWLRGALAEYRHGDPAAGESLMAEVVRRFPDDVSAAIEYAAAAARRKDWLEEQSRWALVRDRFPAERAGWIRGGMSYFQHGDLTSADKVLAEAVKRFPNDVAPAREYAEVAMAGRQWLEASKRWAFVRERFPTERVGWTHGAHASLWFMVEGIASGRKPAECDDYVQLVLREPIDWNDPEFLPAGVAVTLLGGYDTKIQQAIIGRLSEAIEDQLSKGDLTEAAELIALCIDLHPDKLPIDALVDKYVRSAGYRLFCNIFYRHNQANTSALLRWARNAVTKSEAMPLGASQVFQLLLFLVTHDQALATATLKHYVTKGTKVDGDAMSAILEKIYSLRDKQDKVDAPAIVDAMPKRLRIAVCISGQLRGFEQALQTWSFLDTEHQIDRFVHVWRAVGWKIPGPTTAARTFTEPLEQAFVRACTLMGLSAVKDNFPSLFAYLEEGGDAATPGRLMTLYGTDHVRVEDDLDNRFAGYSNQRKMLYKIRECHRLALDNSSHFDLVMRIRPDLALEGASNLDFARTYFECNKRRTIFAESNPWVERNGYCVGDQFVIGSLDCMNVFAETLDLTLQPAAGKPPHLLNDFRPHVNLGHATFGSGIFVSPLPGVGFGPLLNPAALTSEQVRELILKDMGDRPRNIADELLLRACDE